jgi:hypothetical protein
MGMLFMGGSHAVIVQRAPGRSLLGSWFNNYIMTRSSSEASCYTLLEGLVVDHVAVSFILGAAIHTEIEMRGSACFYA